MKKTILSIALALVFTAALAQKPQPDLPNQKYGPGERNVMDVWFAKSDKPAPLAIFVHGGGFTSGDKSSLNKAALSELLESGITVAAINYRYRTGESEGVMASLSDVKYALQYLRHNAGKWNIDKNCVGMMGGSAGAGSSLWIAFHDDMADPKAKDPVLRESTRIQAAAVSSPQATYDLLQWPGLYGLDPDNKYVKVDANALNLYGIESIDELDTPEGKKKRAELDMLSMLTSDDPPFYAGCKHTAELPPSSHGQFIHHPLHVKLLKERAEKAGVECKAAVPAYGYLSDLSNTAFIIEKLTKK